MDDFHYHFQSIVGLQSETALACELLLRSKEKFDPATINPLFFTSNLKSLTAKKIEAMNYLNRIETQWVFVNFSKSEIGHEDFYYCQAVMASLLADRQIVIEVTECNASYNEAIFYENITILKANGFGIAIDDFGTGSSTKHTLRNIKPDFVKLDMSLIRSATHSTSKEVAFFRLTDLLRHQGYKVVIEGIETEKQLAIAKKSRAEFGQGFFFTNQKSHSQIRFILSKQFKDTNHLLCLLYTQLCRL